jgi:hypothetical protein
LESTLSTNYTNAKAEREMNAHTDLVQSLSDSELCQTLLGLVQNKPLAHACLEELVTRWQRDKAKAVPFTRLDGLCRALDRVLAEAVETPTSYSTPLRLVAATSSEAGY